MIRYPCPSIEVFHFQLNQRKLLYKKPNSHRTGLEHQHGRRFNVLEHDLLVANRKKHSKIGNFIFVKCFELNTPCQSSTEEVSFEWSL